MSGSGGSVYSHGDGKRDKKEDEKKKDVGKQIEKGIADAGKAVGKFFSGLGGSEKKWQAKGGGQKLGTANEQPPQPQQPQQARGGSSSQRPPAAPAAPPSGPSGPPTDKAALAAAAEARAAKLNQPKASAAKSAALGRHRTFAPSEPPTNGSDGGGFDPTRAQFTSLSTARSAVDVDNALDAERRAAQTAEERWRAAGAPAAGGAPAATAAHAVTPDDRLLAQLHDMGFEHDDARNALAAAGNDMEVAISILSDDAAAARAQGGMAAGDAPARAPAAQPEAPAETAAAVSELVAAARADANTAGPDGGAAVAGLSLVHKLLANLAAHPEEAKYRRIRRTNPKIAAALEAAPAAERLLVLAGFEADATGEFYDYSAERGLAQTLAAIEAGMAQLGRSALHAPRAAGAGASPQSQRTPPAFDEPRNLTVYRAPRAGSSAMRFDVPDEFYELGPAEAKAILAASASKRQLESTLRTRAQREADAAQRRRVHVRALLRVRLPDGFILQGTFGAHEPVSALYDFVASSLREQGLEFHLTRPPGTAERGRSLRLDDFTATITSADLAPASVLNCHVAEASAASSSGPPFLRADLMELAQELETIE